MECFRLLFDHLACIEHQFLIGIRDSREAGSLWGMMRGMGGVKKLIGQRVRLRVTMWRFYGSSGRNSVGRSQHSSNRVSDIFTRTMHQSTTPSFSQTLWPRWAVPQPPYSLDLAPYDFWLFPKFRGCRYETIEEMKEAGTKVIDTLKQDDFEECLPEVIGTVQQVHCSRMRLLRRGREFHLCTINKIAHTKKTLETYRMHLVSSFSFYKSIFCAFVHLRGCSCPYMCLYV